MYREDFAEGRGKWRLLGMLYHKATNTIQFAIGCSHSARSVSDSYCQECLPSCISPPALSTERSPFLPYHSFESTHTLTHSSEVKTHKEKSNKAPPLCIRVARVHFFPSFRFSMLYHACLMNISLQTKEKRGSVIFSLKRNNVKGFSFQRTWAGNTLS